MKSSFKKPTSLTISNGKAINEENNHVIKISIAARRMFKRSHGDSKNIMAIKRSKLKVKICVEF